jgi:hypothetical protein
MRLLVIGLVSAVVVAGSAAPATAASGTIGAPSIGDPYYALDGNGGYGVGHYDIRLSYQPATDVLWGTTTIYRRSPTKRLVTRELWTTARVVDNKETGPPAARREARFRQRGSATSCRTGPSSRCRSPTAP